ncbi:succinate dehydrogenase [Paenibacillus thalictri]|uniref:Succinate dehydrogenase n=1 Tax=Paenibacillus thalictri TaxID=2527873 RepID=A0A4Q9DPD4_9BACL|nr:succinate dehydrogenase [Paenibacillus thalictri]TBL75991.1 succinate dehydrogenase [Paenibacillus thalictri]
MSTTTRTAAPASAVRFLLLRLHSLAGIVPLGLFLFEHLYSNAVAMLGETAYNEQIGRLQSIPFLGLFELVCIALPLLYHAGYGIYIAFTGRLNTRSYSYARNWMFVLQRVSGVVTLVFVLYHLWAFRFAQMLFGRTIDFGYVSGHLHHPPVLLFYAVGTLSAAFHFTNGLAAGLITWGITIRPQAQRVSARICFGLFIVLSVVWLATLLAF